MTLEPQTSKIEHLTSNIEHRTSNIPSPRMLVLGLDAAESSLVQKWSDEGVLPTLAFLRRKGASVSLAQDRPIPSASVWPSIYTGVHPGRHGIYNSLQIEPGKQDFELLRPDQAGEPPFWQILDRHNKAAIVMDVPFSYPLADFGGRILWQRKQTLLRDNKVRTLAIVPKAGAKNGFHHCTTTRSNFSLFRAKATLNQLAGLTESIRA